ncbi:MAG: hypothetical protein M3535_09655, partial [Actinomycetota bacterium]|nr:hypothetical protein [Actinomycetota bacterium]
MGQAVTGMVSASSEQATTALPTYSYEYTRKEVKLVKSTKNSGGARKGTAMGLLATGVSMVLLMLFGGTASAQTSGGESGDTAASVSQNETNPESTEASNTSGGDGSSTSGDA